MTASSYTCSAGGGLREVCAAVARGRRLLWGLVHLNGLHGDLLGHCPTYETQRRTHALSCPATTCTKHPQAPSCPGSGMLLPNSYCYLSWEPKEGLLS